MRAYCFKQDARVVGDGCASVQNSISAQDSGNNDPVSPPLRSAAMEVRSIGCLGWGRCVLCSCGLRVCRLTIHSGLVT